MKNGFIMRIKNVKNMTKSRTAFKFSSFNARVLKVFSFHMHFCPTWLWKDIPYYIMVKYGKHLGLGVGVDA